MYFKIGPKEKDDCFSFIISKHPDSTFSRCLGSGQVVTGSFNPTKTFYEGHVENGLLTFLDTARQLNMSSYVHVQPSAVCPHNLRALDKIFHSAIRGRHGDDIPSIDFIQPKYLEMVIGPYPLWSIEHLREIFGELGIDAVRDAQFPELESFMLCLETLKSMSVTEFLQKVYLISFYATSQYNLTRIGNEQIEKFVNLCKDWLDRTKSRNKIINKLCKRNKGLVETFEKGIADSIQEEEKKEERLSQIEVFLHKMGLHEQRHNLVIQKVQESAAKTIVDLGCGEGKLAKKLKATCPEIHILGLEADAFRVEKAIHNVRGPNVKFIQSNLLDPLVESNHLCPDLLTLIEVIEHLGVEERQRLILLIRDMFQPKTLIISTPNKEYNKVWGMAEDEMRHRDHLVEYDSVQFMKEVIEPLQDVYDIKYIHLIPDVDVQPSFIIYCVRKMPQILNTSLLHSVKDIYSSIYLSKANYRIVAKEIAGGLASKQMLCNSKNIFYLAPTIAPVEHIFEVPDYLEHPKACFDYYKERGITYLVVEEKYMGSRGYVLAFKTSEIAHRLGYDSAVIVNSRQGFPFFNSQDFPNDLAEIQEKMPYDFIVLDCEVLPWCLKAEKLIQKEFRVPGECALLSRVYGQYGCVENAKHFLHTLGTFAKKGPLCVRMFQVLAYGYVDMSKGRFKQYTNGFALNRREGHNVLKSLEGDIFKPTKYWIMNLNSIDDQELIVDRWREHCEGNSEGFVFKPLHPICYTTSGSLVQPALKVRGKDYLRIIYGIDYLDNNLFDKLKRRHIKGKRALALREYELSLQILRAFLHNNKVMQRKLVAAFIGMENTVINTIDATL